MKKRAKNRVFLGRLLIAIVIIALVSVIMIIYANSKKNINPSECSKDSDCIKVQTTCCPCSMGGEESCVLKTKADDFKAKDCEEKLMCAAVYSCNMNECICRDGKCESQ